MKFDLKSKKIAFGGAGALALALSLGGVAYAQKANPMDTNGDGNMTRAEVQAGAAAMFDKMDANNDGKLDATDREVHMTQMRAKRFEAMDTDKNGSISKAEWDASAEKRMDRKEMRGGGHEGHGKMGTGDDMDHSKMDHSKMGMGRGGMKGGKHGGPGMMHGMMDTNKDGTVTKDEAVAAALARFDANDTNKDGTITKAERDAAKAARQAGKAAAPAQ